jgi:hypothetical protein
MSVWGYCETSVASCIHIQHLYLNSPLSLSLSHLVLEWLWTERPGSIVGMDQDFLFDTTPKSALELIQRRV